MIIFIAWHLTDKGEHTTLHQINKNLFIKPQTYKHNIVLLAHYTHGCTEGM